ncbi:MAG: BatA and WFA domain-containing protein, partial [Planctomycetes bacterium]|nr:BatA and WFA domain-containing protein [Planctomycetota bacterium]
MGLLVATVIFANPGLWLGLLALGIPLLIHLLTRRTPKKMTFPTLQFLRKAMARKSNLYRVRNWLLLLLRTALVLFVLLVFLKPVWTQGASRSLADAEAVRTQIILLDTSASMGYVSAGVMPFAQAKVAVGKILAEHRPGDRINLIRMGRTPRACLDEPSDSVFFIRKDLQTMVVSEEHAQINAALAEALRQREMISEGR